MGTEVQKVVIDGREFPEFFIPPESQTTYAIGRASAKTLTNPRYHHSFIEIEGAGGSYRGEFIYTNANSFTRHGNGIMHYENGSIYEG